MKFSVQYSILLAAALAGCAVAVPVPGSELDGKTDPIDAGAPGAVARKVAKIEPDNKLAELVVGVSDEEEDQDLNGDSSDDQPTGDLTSGTSGAAAMDQGEDRRSPSSTGDSPIEAAGFTGDDKVQDANSEPFNTGNSEGLSAGGLPSTEIQATDNTVGGKTDPIDAITPGTVARIVAKIEPDNRLAKLVRDEEEDQDPDEDSTDDESKGDLTSGASGAAAKDQGEDPTTVDSTEIRSLAANGSEKVVTNEPMLEPTDKDDDGNRMEAATSGEDNSENLSTGDSSIEGGGSTAGEKFDDAGSEPFSQGGSEDLSAGESLGHEIAGKGSAPFDQGSSKEVSTGASGGEPTIQPAAAGEVSDANPKPINQASGEEVSNDSLHKEGGATIEAAKGPAPPAKNDDSNETKHKPSAGESKVGGVSSADKSDDTDSSNTESGKNDSGEIDVDETNSNKNADSSNSPGKINADETNPNKNADSSNTPGKNGVDATDANKNVDSSKPQAASSSKDTSSERKPPAQAVAGDSKTADDNATAVPKIDSSASLNNPAVAVGILSFVFALACY